MAFDKGFGSDKRVRKLRKLCRHFASKESHCADCDDGDESDKNSILGKSGSFFVGKELSGFVEWNVHGGLGGKVGLVLDNSDLRTLDACRDNHS